VSTAERLSRAAQRLEEASELALLDSAQASVHYLALSARVRGLLRDLDRGHTPSVEAVRALARSVEAVADRAPTDCEEQRRADGATLTLCGLAEDLEEGL
jgi:hypothetical protein